MHCLFVFLGVLTLVVLVQAQDQSGFISIDCGLPENSSYTEKNTGIYYISDAQFIDTGLSKSVSPEYQTNHQQQLRNLRSFPNGVRNCYRINVTAGTKYLIRASFLYGNYDLQDDPPQFDIYLGVNLWDTVKFTNSSISTNSEIIRIPLLDYIHLCLVNTNTGMPFISAIELRTLNNDTYVTRSDVSLAHFLRLDLGSITNLTTYRFNDDVYDRLWTPAAASSRWTQISSTLSISNDDLAQNDYEPPAVVMSTAAAPKNASASFEFYWNSDHVNDKYYVYMHFNEVQNLTANETREFNVTLNGKLWYGPLIPLYQVTTTVFASMELTGEKGYQFSFVKTETSSLPPIINAIEIYKIKNFSQSETRLDDVDAITNIKNAYRVARNWQGDPCAPVAYLWEGLSCSFEVNSPPRITSLYVYESQNNPSLSL